MDRKKRKVQKIPEDLSVPSFLIRKKGDKAAPVVASRSVVARQVGRPERAANRWLRELLPEEKLREIVARDKALREEIEAGKSRRSEAGFKNRLASLKRAGKWIPGAIWDQKACRWIHPGQTSTKQKDETKMAKKQRTKKKTAGARKKKSDGVRQIRAGSDREKIFLMAKEGKTLEQMATAIKSTRKNVMTTLYCLKRDKAFKDYEVKENDTVKITLPEGVTAAKLVAPEADAVAA